MTGARTRLAEQTTRRSNLSKDFERKLKAKRKCRVLIIEDDELEVMLAMAYLQRLDREMEIRWVNNTADAIQLLEAESFDFIFGDFYLDSRGSGLAIWFEFRKKHCSGEFYIFSSMGVENYLNIVNGLKTCPAFLPKPLNIELFREVLGY